jgi:hypothetical protein
MKLQKYVKNRPDRTIQKKTPPEADTKADAKAGL